MDIIYREYKKIDRKSVINLLKQLHRYHYNARKDIFLSHISNVEEVFNYMESSHTIYVAEEISMSRRTRLIGFATCYSIRAQMDSFSKPIDTLVISDLFVEKDVRKQGVGTSLVNMCKQQAKEQGCGRVELGVWGFNTESIRFYESLGFSTKLMTMETKV